MARRKRKKQPTQPAWQPKPPGEYRSKFEGNIAAALEKAGLIYEYEPWTLEYWLPKGYGVCPKCGCRDIHIPKQYLPDFWLPKQEIVVEAKGRFLSRDRTKMQAVRKTNPDVRIIMVFMQDQFLTKAKSARYSDWCRRNNVEYVIGIPALMERIANG